MNAKPNAAKKSALYTRSLKAGLSLAVVTLVFFTVQTVQPVLNDPGTSSYQTQDSWIGATPVSAGVAADGKKLYTTRCMSCHQNNGQGVTGVFPPLAGSEWVTGKPDLMVNVILHGLTGEISVKGVKYSGAMPPWGTFLKDDEVAAISNYVRTSWGNKASEITAEEVTKIREATKSRKQPWTAAELGLTAQAGK